ncbi:heparinase II/III family protein [Brevundimonas sp.]|uniref:heparinase II/III domain-containing protein n=1 Tax=Brevundimonas sp. TaxID=1871086 RepID=UPI0035AE39DD
MTSPETVRLLAATLPRLGLGNVAAVALYRARARLGQVAPDPPGQSPAAPVFSLPREPAAWPDRVAALEEAQGLANGELRGLGELRLTFGNPPEWSVNALTFRQSSFRDSWWKGSDQDTDLGDIKGVWEASRFDWALALARAARHGDAESVKRLNHLVADWISNAPPFKTLNWRCGQEAALRMVQLLLAAHVLGQDHASSRLAPFVAVTLERILPSLSYAMAQDNDHGFSESAGLFIGGAWLARHGAEDFKELGKRAARIGRTGLENRIRRLVFADGGTANYSTNYHRFILDWLTQAELWRRRLGQAAFSSGFAERAAAATRLMAILTNAVNGDAPNLGSNDGARAFRLEGLPYRDYRPTVQLSGATFLNLRMYAPGPWDEPLAWQGVVAGGDAPPNSETGVSVFESFGLAKIGVPGSYGFLKAPRARFRPQQADPLHFDLWTAAGDNWLGDGGTYSYFDVSGAEQVTSIRGHNTIQFDDREPMRRISRFLYADWIEGSAFESNADSIQAAYRDYAGAAHARSVTAAGEVWRIEDRISGYQSHATLRWRLPLADWRLEGRKASCRGMEIEIESDVPIERLELRPYVHAPGYGELKPCLQLEARVGPTARQLRTTIRLTPGG